MRSRGKVLLLSLGGTDLEKWGWGRKGKVGQEKLDTMYYDSGQAWWQAVKTHRGVSQQVCSLWLWNLSRFVKWHCSSEQSIKWRKKGNVMSSFFHLTLPIGQGLAVGLYHLVRGYRLRKPDLMLTCVALPPALEGGGETQVRQAGSAAVWTPAGSGSWARQQLCAVRGRQHLGKEDSAMGIWGGVGSLFQYSLTTSKSNINPLPSLRIIHSASPPSAVIYCYCIFFLFCRTYLL